MQQIKSGSRGELVALVQLMLNEKGYSCSSADGIFGTKTESAVRSYQKAKGLSVDGIVGTNTYAKLFTECLLKRGSRGELVKALQTRLNEQGYGAGTADGIFGSNTEQAVKALQSAAGIATDGKVGKNTWTALLEGKAAGIPASAHFKLSEFKCKDGTAVPAKYYANCQKLMNLLEEIESCVREPGDYRYERIPNGELQQEGGRSQAEPAPIRGGSRHQGKRKERIRGVQAVRYVGRQPRGRREIQHVYACGCARA